MAGIDSRTGSETGHESVLAPHGVRPIVNAAGPVTRLGGGPLRPEVVAALILALEQGEPRVWLSQEDLDAGVLTVNPLVLQLGEERIVAERLCAELRRERGAGRRRTIISCYRNEG